VSTLTQQVRDDLGTRSRLSDDRLAVALADDLNAELQSIVPDAYTIGLVLGSPILKFRKTKAELAKVIRSCLADLRCLASDQEVQINGNFIKIFLRKHGEPATYKKVSAVVMHRTASPDILSNTAWILEDRIKVKGNKCERLRNGRPIWLALLNDYWLTDVHTYRLAFSRIEVAHPFAKILLVGGNASVDLLYEQA
jgi:hypothetical protein